MRRTIEAEHVEEQAGHGMLVAPRPGRVRLERLVGEALVPGSRLGTWQANELVYELRVPRAARGRVSEHLARGAWVTCERGTPLVRLAPLLADDEASAGGAGAAAGGGEEGLFLRSRTHGTFYRRASPESPAYVEVGQEIEEGATVGLVEVMKCFSPILFESPGGAGRVRVAEVLVEDGQEVQVDQPLLRFEAP